MDGRLLYVNLRGHFEMKRFTETDKWRDPWFRKLSAGAKLAFYYIVENCDNSGVWTPDTELADFSIGMAIPWDKVKEAFGNRLLILSSGDWLMLKFVSFQYGQLSPDCKPHLQVLRLIEKHRVSKGYPKGINTLEEKDKDKDKGSAEGAKSATDSDWVKGLIDQECYKPVDVVTELSKAKVWCENNHRRCTRKFFVNWLNRALENSRVGGGYGPTAARIPTLAEQQ